VNFKEEDSRQARKTWIPHKNKKK